MMFNMFNRLFIISLFLFLLLFFVGCSSFNYGTGVVINDFSFDPKLVSAGSHVYLTLKLQNQGQFDAEDAYLYIYGLRSEWDLISDEYVNNGIDEPIYFEQIIAPEIQGNKVLSQGQIMFYDWLFIAPKDVVGSDVRVNTVYSRLCYSYKTIVNSKIDVISVNEFDKGVKQENIKYTVSKGPLEVRIDSNQPVVLQENDGGFNLIDLNLKNVGDGTFLNNIDGGFCSDFSKSSEYDRNIISDVKVYLDGVLSCGFAKDESYFDDGLYLRRGDNQNFRIICDGLDLGNLPKKTYDLRIEFNYDYYIDSSADVGVKGLSR
jgi:hypothetical protein